MPRTWRRRRRRGKGEGREEDWIRSGSRRRRRSRWSWSRRCQSRRSVPAVGARQCPFLSPIVNITGPLSPWHTRNRTFWAAAPAPGARSLDASNGKRGLIGRRPPSLPCQHVRLRDGQGLAAGGRRHWRVGREESADWAEGEGPGCGRELRPRCCRFRQEAGWLETGDGQCRRPA